jgi:hypothetical protein
MNVEQFVTRLRAVLYAAHGWEDPLTMERLDQILATTMSKWVDEFYGVDEA